MYFHDSTIVDGAHRLTSSVLNSSAALTSGSLVSQAGGFQRSRNWRSSCVKYFFPEVFSPSTMYLPEALENTGPYPKIHHGLKKPLQADRNLKRL